MNFNIQGMALIIIIDSKRQLIMNFGNQVLWNKIWTLVFSHYFSFLKKSVKILGKMYFLLEEA